ncbi:hypothetical protein Shyd_60820 [Streptomyces hydrogenans]|uniref:Uncharacterized protein n=1 Tax=Streptomyces hydrogenans TaxID=1873719 RepID=A0ABQ3PI63_9ACTN|nr:hypothetical protein GCM10018784_73420 [Streptomyces hydrogenans]GHI24711.1 hypothetical protein Shyd_60820 [Streptomyces hydrogenans]
MVGEFKAGEHSLLDALPADAGEPPLLPEAEEIGTGVPVSVSVSYADPETIEVVRTAGGRRPWSGSASTGRGCALRRSARSRTPSRNRWSFRNMRPGGRRRGPVGPLGPAGARAEWWGRDKEVSHAEACRAPRRR